MWALTFFAIALVLWIFWRKRNFSVLKKLGIPGPEPNFLFGNLLEMVMKNPIQCHKEWIQKYGKVVGYYFGTEPVVLITDVELLKRIQISDFHKFMNRPSLFRGRRRKPNEMRRVEGFSQQLVILKDKKWKDIRSILTPSFTAAKMKQMAPIINDAIDSLINNVEKKSKAGESFDIYPMYQGLTMDVIGRSAFGIQTDVQNDPNDPFLRSARVIFSGDIRSALFIIAVSFRRLERFWSFVNRMRLAIKNKGTNPVNELIESVKNVINLRRKDKESRRPDLLQLMIDAEVDDTSVVTTEELTAKDDNENTEKKTTGSSSGRLVRQMTDADILDNSVLFFLAGYETTSTALAFTTHLLVHYPEVQDRVREEVLQLLKSENELDYYSVNKLQYLDNVLHESLRLYPPIHLFVNRECAEDVDLGKIRLKKGLAIQVPVFNLHRDPELWEDPDEFKPERFSPENKEKLNPLAYQPFGAGPRNCVGMRFALMEAKLALARLLSKYKLKPCAETDNEPITLKIATISINPKKGIHLKAIPL
ncbi:cytochrome P450 3A24-like isoform X2 [Stegodyphus dumicola]|uniref:cytochrome P450 3A24-like isoform X2 n=1 Tax=Stegodyphus dumicola TaxID=202533 RepID=UPI0015AC93B3|nr:cytochrome P450 3A24-like isoform X2 [Stegodyphus dumicola]